MTYTDINRDELFISSFEQLFTGSEVEEWEWWER
jgi:hypothetical protein